MLQFDQGTDIWMTIEFEMDKQFGRLHFDLGTDIVDPNWVWQENNKHIDINNIIALILINIIHFLLFNFRV